MLMTLYYVFDFSVYSMIALTPGRSEFEKDYSFFIKSLILPLLYLYIFSFFFNVILFLHFNLIFVSFSFFLHHNFDNSDSSSLFRLFCFNHYTSHAWFLSYWSSSPLRSHFYFPTTLYFPLFFFILWSFID